MKIETIKTVILTILVLISLLLTFALWDYQPYNRSELHSQYVSEVNLGGGEETKSTIISPKQVVFKRNEGYFGFNHPTADQKLYESMQRWVLSDLKSIPTTKGMEDQYNVLIQFQTALPTEIIRYLFVLNEDDPLPNWSFKDIILTFNDDDLNIGMTFPSIDGQQELQYTVNDSNVYKDLMAFITDGEELVEYVAFGSEDKPIYIPNNEVEMKSYSLAANTIKSSLLISALFNDPSLVNTNYSFGEVYYNDGQRGMRILQEGRNMEFINPIHATDEQTNMIDLLDWSLQNINAHKGWTDDYRLIDINVKDNAVKYQMHYDRYPIFNNKDLSLMEQQIINQDLHMYRRPLFNLVNSFSSNTEMLPSGQQVIYYLTHSDHYDHSKIQDIQIGYKLTYVDRSTHTVSLDPAWYMNYQGTWMEIKIKEDNMGGA